MPLQSRCSKRLFKLMDSANLPFLWLSLACTILKLSNWTDSRCPNALPNWTSSFFSLWAYLEPRKWAEKGGYSGPHCQFFLKIQNPVCFQFSGNQKVALTSAKRQQNPHSSFSQKFWKKREKLTTWGPPTNFSRKTDRVGPTLRFPILFSSHYSFSALGPSPQLLTQTSSHNDCLSCSDKFIVEVFNQNIRQHIHYSFSMTILKCTYLTQRSKLTELLHLDV